MLRQERQASGKHEGMGELGRVDGATGVPGVAASERAEPGGGCRSGSASGCLFPGCVSLRHVLVVVVCYMEAGPCMRR